MIVPRLSYPGQRKKRQPRQADVEPAFTTEAAERTWAGQPPKRTHAAASTFEAALYTLRTHGAARLRDEKLLDQLGEFSSAQLAQLVSALAKLRSQHASTITADLIAQLTELANAD